MTPPPDWTQTFFADPDWIAFHTAAWSDEETLIDCDAIEALMVNDDTTQRGALTLLDIPCGEGRHAIELARRGYAVTGIDQSEPLLTLARAKNSTATFRNADMRSFTLPTPVDAACSFWSSLGYGTEEDDKNYFCAVHAALKPGGLFIVDTLVAETLRDNMKPEVIRQEKPFVLRQKNRYDTKTGRLFIDWCFERPEKTHTLSSSLRIYTVEELAALLAECGFENFDAFGDIDLAPFDEKAERLILRCQKG